MTYSPYRRDYVKALILERQKREGRTNRELANAIQVSPQTFSRMINHQHTDDWELWKIRKLLTILNVTKSEFSECLTM